MDGTQTQIRRPLKVQPLTSKSKLITLAETTDRDERKYEGWNYWAEIDGLRVNRDTQSRYFKPRHKVGNIIGVRERVRLVYLSNEPVKLTEFPLLNRFRYEVDGMVVELKEWPKRVKSIKPGHCVPNGCFKELIRTFLKVKAIRFERIQDISENDAMAEGVSLEQAMSLCCQDGFTAYFSGLWESIYPGSWDRNCWVEVTEFELTDKPKEL
jgi:hypothetical protein